MAFDNARRKLERAEAHLGALEASMAHELDAKAHELTQRGRTTIGPSGTAATVLDGLDFVTPPVLPPEWALLIGDFAANARAALDHLAWELATRNVWRAARNSGGSWPPPTSTYFPMVVDRPRQARRKKSVKKRLSLFRPAERKIVAAQQPYRRGKLGRAEPIWLLYQIRNVDAHRELHTVLPGVPAAALSDLHRLVPTPEGGEEFYWPKRVRDAVERVLENPTPGDVVATTVTMSAKFSPYVKFDMPGEDFDGLEVLPVLRSCRDEVDRIIGLFPA